MDRRGFLVGVGAVVVATPAFADTLFVNTNSGAGLNVREGPGTQFAVITTIREGTAVVVLRRESGWARVRIPNGTVGWCSLTYLTVTRPVAGTGPVAGAVLVVQAPRGNSIKLRAAPDMRSAVLRDMPNGTRVTLMGQEKDQWVRVKHPSGDIGWAFRPALRLP